MNEHGFRTAAATLTFDLCLKRVYCPTNDVGLLRNVALKLFAVHVVIKLIIFENN